MTQFKVFISHSSKDERIAQYLCSYLLGIGVNRSDIFCSSIPEHGVFQKISGEIRTALKSSIIDIVVLTPNYQMSDYCLNEAGIIWFKDSSLKLVITLPDMSHHEQVGFINGDFIYHDLSDERFINTLYDKISTKLSGLNTQSMLQLERARIDCLKSLPIAGSACSNSALRFDVASSQRVLQDCLVDYSKKCCNPSVFYQRHSRSVSISAGEADGYIRVTTGTQMTVVNLSAHSHVEVFKPQFLKGEGGKNTYRMTAIVKDGELLSNTLSEPNQSLQSDIGRRSSYAYGEKHTVTVEPHRISDISLESVYETPLEMFFQSKVIGLPCVEYSLAAWFDDSFKERYGSSYIFRYQIAPPNSRTSTTTLLQTSATNGDPSKDVVNINFCNGVLPGTGYALAISKKR